MGLCLDASSVAAASVLACGDDDPTSFELDENGFALFLAVDLSAMTETASGLLYQDFTVGTGDVATSGTSVTVHYTGWTTDGAMFDSSVQRGDPATFGLNQVIPGWTEGLQLMSVGSKYMLWVPQELGYGMQPRAGVPFGPGETLVFEVELLDILD